MDMLDQDNGHARTCNNAGTTARFKMVSNHMHAYQNHINAGRSAGLINGSHSTKIFVKCIASAI